MIWPYRRYSNPNGEKSCNGGLQNQLDASSQALHRWSRCSERWSEEGQIDQDTRLRVYRLRPEPFIALQAWLDQTQAFWTEQLDAFKEHIECTQKGKQI